MDDSMSSTNYMTSQLHSFSSAPDNSSEESGWTLYFEDFLANSNNNKNYNFDYSSSSSSRYNTSSMVSDAHFNKLPNKKCISKNRKAITAKNFVDEELEDTASSPSHTPKINDLDHMYIKSKQLDAQNVSQEKVGIQTSQRAIEDSDMGFLEKQLRRKGLCSVPMSMLLDHL